MTSDILILGQKQAPLFTADNIAYSETLVTCYVPRHILVCAYRCLVRRGRLIPVEELSQAQKELAWQTAKDIARGRLPRSNLVEIVQALLALEYFLSMETK